MLGPACREGRRQNSAASFIGAERSAAVASSSKGRPLTSMATQAAAAARPGAAWRTLWVWGAALACAPRRPASVPVLVGIQFEQLAGKCLRLSRSAASSCKASFWK